MRRLRPWTFGIAIAALVVVVILIGLPFGVRALAVHRLEAMTGRRVTIGDVDLNPFTRRIAFTGVQILGPGAEPPLVDIRRVEARFRWLPIFRGAVFLERVRLVEPSVYVVREDDGALRADDVIEHWRARPAAGPLRATLDSLIVERGRVTFADRAVSPAREWRVRAIGVDAHDITTVADAAGGRLSATFAIGDAPGQIHVERLGVRPFRAHARLSLDGLDVTPFGAYFAPDAPLRLAGGRFAPRITVDYGADGVLRASGESTLQDLALVRPGQDPPFIAIPLLSFHASGVTYAAGKVSAGGVTVNADRATIFAATAARPRPLDVRDIAVRFDHPSAPSAGPGRLALSATLPGDGTVDAHGTGELQPLAADLAVDIRGLDVALAGIWLPPDVALMPTAGRLGATVDVGYARATGARLGGRAWISGLALARGDQTLVRDDRIDLTLSELRADNRGARLGRMAVTASPTIILGPDAEPLAISSLTVTVEGGGLHDTEPSQITGRAVLPNAGGIAVTGDAHLDARTARLTLTASNLDTTLVTRYLPRAVPVTIDRGRLDAKLDVAWHTGLDVGGRVTLRHLTVRRRGEETPVIEHGVLQAAITDLSVREDALTLGRATVSGSPTIVDGSASPPARFDLASLMLTARDLTWPGRRAMRLEGHAETADGGRASLTGSLHPGTLATDVNVSFDAIALAHARGYLPSSLTFDGGRLRGTIALRHTPRGETHIEAKGAIDDLALGMRDPAPVRVSDDHATFAVDDVAITRDGVRVGSVVFEASPRIGRGDDLADPFDIRAELSDFTWPRRRLADLALTAHPGGGRVDVSGTFAPDTAVVSARVRASDAALEPFAAFAPIEAALGGRLDARIDGTLPLRRPAALAATGSLTLSSFHIGPVDTAPVRIDAMTVDGLDVGETGIRAARVTVAKPAIVIERERDGSFPLRAMLTPGTEGSAAPREVATDPPRTTADAASTYALSVDALTISGGTLRFLDRTTHPVYSEELTRLEVGVRDVTNGGDHTAGVTIQGIVGADAALDLRGEIAPFASPFFLDIAGELQDFSVPHTNPYLQRFLDWIARRGQLTTKVHYRIVGDELHATNELTVHRLDVERVRGDDRAERLVGVPLGLAVALLKDAHGNIHFTLPVSGSLGSPRFSFADAIKSALRNVVGRLVTAPFRAIGSIFRRGEGADEFHVDPVTFAPGSAALTPDAASQLQRVAEVLREHPYVGVALTPVVSDRDIEVLRAREVTARIQRVRREERLESFAAAARRVWRERMPGGPPAPDDPQALVAALARREPVPTEEAHRLAKRRASVTRTQLVEAASGGAARLKDAAQPALGANGVGRVEFRLEPAS